MKARARFRCQAVTHHANGDITASLTPSAGYTGAENAEFFKYAPSARIDLGPLHSSIAGHFRAGAEYFVDFDPLNPEI